MKNLHDPRPISFTNFKRPYVTERFVIQLNPISLNSEQQNSEILFQKPSIHRLEMNRIHIIRIYTLIPVLADNSHKNAISV